MIKSGRRERLIYAKKGSEESVDGRSRSCGLRQNRIETDTDFSYR